MVDPRIVSIHDDGHYANIHYKFDNPGGSPVESQSVIDLRYHADALAGATPEGRMEFLRHYASEEVDEVEASARRSQATATALFAEREAL
ncbi:hypothetical protein NE857_21930 [Nocardiopsis exhalans]|uniref:Uncharacterized protein n=1 Tax=Nocardiopsis exhalans TaxID=163604 RepID=A0ABY5D401_9ACTN|nr:hypothetical protein [Nocardiopsis exhalans]USY17978.1 hypothetical protein NE857_21930 [Nocardiopsis exhalans]